MSDLNSNIPVTIAPQNIQAIITGSGGNYGEIKYIKSSSLDKFTKESIIYSSGTGAIFKSGTPIGKIKDTTDQSSGKFIIEFFSDFSQLKYVFAEVITKSEIENKSLETSTQSESPSITPMSAKIKILEDELKIVEDIKQKFKGENDNLKIKINDLNNQISNFKNEILSQKEKIAQFNLDKMETEFLKMNLYYGHKCRRSFFNSKGFTVGTDEYKECVMNKGRKN